MSQPFREPVWDGSQSQQPHPNSLRGPTPWSRQTGLPLLRIKNKTMSNTRHCFGEWSQHDECAVAYIVDQETGDAVDTIYQSIQTGEIHTHSGKALSEYGLSL